MVGTQRVREKTRDKNNQTIFVERELPVYAQRVYYLRQGRLTGICRMVLLQARKGKVLWQSELSLEKTIQKEARQAELLPPRRSVAKELAEQAVAQTVAEVERSLLPKPKILNRRLAFAAQSSSVFAKRLHAANRLALEGNWEQAVDIWMQLTQEYPEEPEAWVNAAIGFELQEDTESAIRYYENGAQKLGVPWKEYLLQLLQ
jgi:tetratricopeptide (TPR) repeat protein